MLGAVTGVARPFTRQVYSTSFPSGCEGVPMKPLNGILSYLPFLMLALAVLVAIYRIRVYW
jgi:hypothetical protein